MEEERLGTHTPAQHPDPKFLQESCTGPQLTLQWFISKLPRLGFDTTKFPTADLPFASFILTRKHPPC